MKRLAYVAAGLLILAGVARTALDFYSTAIYLAKTDGYAAGRAKYAPRASAEAQAVAQGICDGHLQLAWFDPSFGFAQSDVDDYAQRYTDQGRTCEDVHYLGVVNNLDGSTDEIFAMTITGKNLWYILTFADGLVTAIQ